MKKKIKFYAYNIVFLMLLFILIVCSFQIGRFYPHYDERSWIILGCWKISETNRSILIRVDDRDIEEIIDTQRHELCHEIEFRLTNKSSENETFAKTCNPEDYLYLDNLF